MVGVHGAKADEPFGMLRHRAGDKVVDRRHALPGYGHRVHQMTGDARFLPGTEQFAHRTVQIHGDAVKIADGGRRLPGDFVGIDMRVGINDSHGDRRLCIQSVRSRKGQAEACPMGYQEIIQRYRISSRRGPLDTMRMGAPQAFSIYSTYLRQFSGSSS